MPKFTIAANDGQELTGYLPDDWSTVPLAPYVALLLAAEPVPAGIVPGPHAYANPAGCQALAALLGLPDAEPLLAAKLALLQPLYEAAPWLFDQALPAGEPAPGFTHQGVAYTFAGPLEDVAASQWEALATLLQVSQDNPLAVAPQLLAVLYQPTSQPSTPATTRAAAEAFATLPISLAWPAILDFSTRSAPWALATRTYFTARAGAVEALNALEALLATSPTSAPRGFYWSTGRWLVRRWLKLVRKQLAMYLRPSATTAAAPSWPSNPRPAAK